MKIFNRIVAGANEQRDFDATHLAEQILAEMLTMMAGLDHLVISDFDLDLLKEMILVPVARYLWTNSESSAQPAIPRFSATRRKSPVPRYVDPIFISGQPGIGKTTLLMVLDEALCRLGSLQLKNGSPSLRTMVASGYVQGYFGDKDSIPVTPLRLSGKPTAALSVRDWNNVLRHWTYDEALGDQSDIALDHFIGHMTGKVVIVDEAEFEGYTYFTELLAGHGILILLSSNLPIEFVHLDPTRVSVVPLEGPDHRIGDLARLFKPQDGQNWFDLCAGQKPVKSLLLAGADIRTGELRGQSYVCLEWKSLRNRPLLKDDFAQFLVTSKSDIVLLDGVPFFSDIAAGDIDLTFLGYLSRFVNFVDAVHDCNLRLIMRGTNSEGLDVQAIGPTFRAALAAYDKRTGGTLGQLAWIEWARCLSRVKSLRPADPL